MAGTLMIYVCCMLSAVCDMVIWEVMTSEREGLVFGVCLVLLWARSMEGPIFFCLRSISCRAEEADAFF